MIRTYVLRTTAHICTSFYICTSTSTKSRRTCGAASRMERDQLKLCFLLKHYFKKYKHILDCIKYHAL